MNKEQRDTMRNALRNAKKFPYFVYFPLKKGLGGSASKGKSGLFGESITLEFVKTKGEADALLKELKPKRGNVYAHGLVETTDDGTLRLQCVKAAPEPFVRDLKLLAKQVPELKDAEVTTIAESEEAEKRASVDEEVSKQVAEDVKSSGTSTRKELAKLKDAGVRKSAEAALDRLDAYAEILHEAQSTFATYDKLGPALKTYYGKYDAEFPDRVQAQKQKKLDAEDVVAKHPNPTTDKDKKAVAQAKVDAFTADEEIKSLAGLKRQVEEQWGALTAIRVGARDHLAELVTTFDAAVKLRDKIDGPKTLAKLVAHLDAVQPKLGAVQGEVYRFGEKMVEMQRRIHDYAKTDPDAIIPVPSAPTTIVDVATEARVTPFERLCRTADVLLKSPFLDELLAKQALLADVLKMPAATGAGQEAAAIKGFREDMARTVLASKMTAAKIASGLSKVDSPDKAGKFADGLLKGGVHQSLELANFVHGAQEWVVEVTSKFESLDEFNKKVAAAGLAKFPTKTLEKYLKFPTEYIAGSVVTRASDSGEREVVKLTASGRIIVVGGGPIGLMSAIEASKQGGRVTVFEGRPSEYTRQNVLKLTDATVDRLERYGVYRLLGVVGNERTRMKVADLEDSLSTVVKGMGIRVIKGKGVSELSRDPDTGEMLCVVDGVHEVADLVVVAVGAGVKNANKYAGDVIMSDQLGITVKEFGLVDHVISANLDKNTNVPHETRERTDEDRKAWQVVLETPTQKYVLAQLSEQEYRDNEGSKEKLKAIIRERAKIGGDAFNPDFANLDIADIGRFEVVIQRADKFRGKDLGAVVVGDSAATPHPETGSGTNVGALEVDVVADLVRGLVDSAKERFGKRREKVEEALDSYDERMQDIAGTQTRKGMANMVSVRHRRAKLSFKILNDWRTSLGDAVPLDADVTRILGEIKRTVNSVLPKSTDALFDDWEAAKVRGTLFEDLNTALEKALDAAKKQQAADPTLREALLLTALQRMVYVV